MTPKEQEQFKALRKKLHYEIQRFNYYGKSMSRMQELKLKWELDKGLKKAYEWSLKANYESSIIDSLKNGRKEANHDR